MNILKKYNVVIVHSIGQFQHEKNLSQLLVSFVKEGGNLIILR